MHTAKKRKHSTQQKKEETLFNVMLQFIPEVGLILYFMKQKTLLNDIDDIDHLRLVFETYEKRVKTLVLQL